MADSGFVYVAPADNIPGAVFTGSEIQSRAVLYSNSPDVPTTNVNSTQTENSVFANPGDNNKLMNSNNSTQNPVGSLYGANYLLSDDAGNTWGGSVQGAGGGNSGDPAIAISLGGRHYIGFIDNNDGQSVAYSTNNGVSWTVVAAALENGDLLDKNHMWIDNSPVSPYQGNIYVAYTDFGDTGYPIEVVRSTNGGLSYSTPVSVSDAVNAGSHSQGVNIQTGPDGEVYVLWAIYDTWPSDETALGLAKSTNGGLTYAPATRIISNIRGIRTTETLKDHRVNSFPSMAVDISGGPNNGTIYVVWANTGVPGINTGTGIDVYMIKSSNEGLTWTAPVKVNQDPAGLGKQHYFPWISCDPVTGHLAVVFYDDRNVSSTQCETFCAVSTDGGTSWEDFKVSDVSFTPAPIPGLAGGYMGDYLGISAMGGKVYPVWPDNRSGAMLTYVSPFTVSAAAYARFWASDRQTCVNDPITLNGQQINNPLSWQWSITPPAFSFVNGTSATSQNPQIAFSALGDYSVTLTVTNAQGSDTFTRTNFISVTEATPDFSANTFQTPVNIPVTFTDASTCGAVTYSWNFGAGASPATANTAGPHAVSYSTTGFKTISLTINGTETETKTDYVEILPEAYNMSNAAITTCSGTFYDPQGTGNYLNNLDYTMTFYPADTTKSVQVTFSQFSLESSSGCIYDYLSVYDGPGITSPLLGTWCGTSSPGVVVAYGGSGALTFKFHSDISLVGSGWVASISCVETPPPSTIYCSANGTTCDEHISRVQINTINNPSACTAGGYANYTSIQTRLSPSVSYNLTVTNGKPYGSDQCGVWIDWNRNSLFTDANEVITVSGTPGIGPYTATVIPPANAPKGPTRMRIRIMYTGALSPCGPTNYGEVEDYTIYVGTPGLWTGGAAGAPTDWNNALNWDDGRIPGAGTNVVIPEGVTHYPQVTGSYSCADVQVRDNGTLTVSSGSVLNVQGNLVIGEGVSGTLTVNGGACNVTGTITASPGSTVSLINNGTLTDIN